jgi:hypothetical protein
MTSESPERRAAAAPWIISSVGLLLMYPAARTTLRVKGLRNMADLTMQQGAGVKATMKTTSSSDG